VLAGGSRIHGGLPQRDQAAPLVSIVTIVRNGVQTLNRAIESVLLQDYPCIEHVIVDGQSTDGTLDLLRANDERIALWVSEPDNGISDAFNKGIAFSAGEIIGILNSDDWYEPGAISAAVETMQSSGADIVCGKLQYWEGDCKTYLVTSDANLLERGMTVGHPTVFVRRDAYRKHGLFKTEFKLAMDYEWLLRAKLGGAEFRAVEQCLSNMQGGGVGDHRWRESQREVAKARALYIPSAASRIAYNAYVARSIFKGTVRRGFDALGLSALRRLYHRWLSPVIITSSRNDSKD
jgi:glycosyltransferase involved in cell wall biosynthesis